MASKPLVSIIIATFNSELLLPKVLASVRKQTYPSTSIEILVVDGGSTDKTIDIAKSYKCKVLHNPKMLPAWAKFIGFQQAKGKYALYLDSDEVLASTRSIEKKVAALQKNTSVHAACGSGYISPKGYPFLNAYINEFGDPFSYFYYRLSKDSRYFVDTMKERYFVASEDKDSVAFDFSDNHNLPIFELVAMGSLVDLDYLKKTFKQINTHPGLIPHFFHLLVSKHSLIAIIKNDDIVHYSASTLTHYLGKIRSRIVNNIHTPAKEGFKGRVEFAKGLSRYKSYLFVPYAFSIVFPFVDAVYLCITRRNIGYLMHVGFCLYTASLIMYHMLLKLFGFTPIQKSYGDVRPISSI